MHKNVIDRLNRVPEKNFIEFLGMLGVKLLPAQPAMAPITFALSEGTTEHVLIPARTQIAAGDIIFETEKNIIATPSNLKELFSVIPKEDKIFEHLTELNMGETIELFTKKDIQEHVLYLGHKDLFNINNNARIFLEIKPVEFIAKLKDTVWEYCTGQNPDTKEIKWKELEYGPSDYHSLILTKNTSNQIEEVEINGVKSRWIRCRVKEEKIGDIQDIFIDSIEVIIKSFEKLNPDFAFYNDVPLDFKGLSRGNSVYPFGNMPMLHDTFYIACGDAFSKNADVTLEITGKIASGGIPTPTPYLSWEYWDGKGWIQLSGINKDKKDLKFKTTSNQIDININEFPEVKPTKVNGQENYWIRVRLTGGHYGKEVSIANKNEITPGKVTPPEIESLKISYKTNPQKLEKILIFNSLEFKNVTDEFEHGIKSFKPFTSIDDEHQTFYLGFEKKLEKGPISIFFSIEEQNWASDKLPIIEWEYYTKDDEWVRLEASDETRGFTRTGTIKFLFSSDFKKMNKFGKENYWIRAVNLNDSFKTIKDIIMEQSTEVKSRMINVETLSDMWLRNKYPSSKNVFQGFHKYKAKEGVLESKSIMESCDLAETFQPEWSPSSEFEKEDLSPRIEGIFMNTTWAVQAQTIEDEILGSSDGRKDQSFYLTKNPVITEELWINEIRTISEAEMEEIKESNEFETKEIDVEGNITEFWVKWNSTDDLFTSKADERHYELDKVSGQLKFGDGICGKVPPSGNDNIKVNYSIGGGAKGNKLAFEIKDLKSSIPFVDKAFNPLSASGGEDVELIEKAMERSPLRLKNRDRAITAEDFEQIAYQTSRAIARVKCLQNTDYEWQYNPGWITVLVVPHSTENKPQISLQLKRQVENNLNEHSSNIINLKVSEPVFVEVAVSASIIATNIDLMPNTEKEIIFRLKEFLNPLQGGYNNKGWEFGKAPCISDFYALFEKVDGVDHVDNISVKLKASNNESIISLNRKNEIKIPPYALIYSGEHEIGLNIEKIWGVE